MEWEYLDVWRRQRPYIVTELRKDAPSHLACLGLATGFTVVVGAVEGAILCTQPGDVRFPLRYALFNTLPAFVGGEMSATSVASTMTNVPPLQACSRAIAQAYTLRTMRTVAAGCTLLSVVFQMTLASTRGTDAYEQAVLEGREVPNIFMGLDTKYGNSSRVGGIIRLCGSYGLKAGLSGARHEGEPNGEILEAKEGETRRRCRPPLLPVVISGEADLGEKAPFRLGLPSAALAAIAASYPRPCYFRIDSRRLLSRQAWQPIASEFADAAKNSNNGRDTARFIIEADALSSATPQGLLTGDAEETGMKTMGVDGVHSRGKGQLDADQAVWGLATLRRTLEEAGRGENVAGVILAGERVVIGEDSTVAVDARAAVLSSILAWAKQHTNVTVGRVMKEDNGVLGKTIPRSTSPSTTRAKANIHMELTLEGVLKGLRGGAEPDTEASERRSDEEEHSAEMGEYSSPVSLMLMILERIGSTTRQLLAPPLGTLQAVILGPFSAMPRWFWKRSIGTKAELGDGWSNGYCGILLYDTDDENSFRWLATQMSSQGLTVKRVSTKRQTTRPGLASRIFAGSPRADGAARDYPILVHRCSDEKTLTAAAEHLSRGGTGPPVCIVVHRWDCGAEARRLLHVIPSEVATGVEQHGSLEVICTANVGEGLLEFVRNKLQSGATPSEVQELLDELLSRFY